MAKHLKLTAWILILSFVGCTGKNEQTLKFTSSMAPVVAGIQPDQLSDLSAWYSMSSDKIVLSSNLVQTVKSSGGLSLDLTVPSGKTGPQAVNWKSDGSTTLQALKFQSANSTGLAFPSQVLGDSFTIAILARNIGVGDLLHFAPDIGDPADSGRLSVPSAGIVRSQHMSNSSDVSYKEASVSSSSDASVIVVTFNNAADWGDMQIYVNGFRRTLTTGAVTNSPLAFTYTVRRLLLGGGPASYADFELAEAAVFNRVLTPRDVYALSKGWGLKWGVSISEDLTEEIINDKIDTGSTVLAYDKISRDILQPKGCISCHSASPGNRGGVDLSTYSALKAAVNSQSQRIAIPGVPDTSRLVVVVSGSPPSMPQMATQYGGYLTSDQIAVISQWITEGMRETATSDPLPSEATGDGGGGSGGGGTTTPTTLTFSDMYYGVLSSRCVGCHNSTTTSGGVNLSTYATTIAAVNSSSQAVVVPGSPDTSRLYQVVSGMGLPGGAAKMPALNGGGVGTLSATELNYIKQWILDGGQQ